MTRIIFSWTRNTATLKFQIKKKEMSLLIEINVLKYHQKQQHHNFVFHYNISILILHLFLPHHHNSIILVLMEL